MKKLLTIVLMLLIVSGFAQKTILNEKDVINKTHIDFSKEHILFILHGKIEIDGHTMLNSKRDKPIEYRANLEKVVLTDGDTEYEVRHCELSVCKVIHLVKKSFNNGFIIQPNYNFGWEELLLDSHITPTINLDVSSDTTFLKSKK